MKLINMIPESVTRFAYSAVRFCKINSPIILAVVGTTAIIGGTVMACVATSKVDKVLDQAEENKKELEEKIEKVREEQEAGNIKPEDYTEQDEAADRTQLAIKTGWEFVKLYAPAVTTLGFGICCYLVSFKILRNRELALAASYKLLETSFNKYRQRVIKDAGKVKDIYYATGRKVVEEAKIENDDGSSSVDCVTVKEDDAGEVEYTRIFDECNAPTVWAKNYNDNLFFLKTRLDDANRQLRIRGYLYLSDVFKMLGLSETKSSRKVGWVYDKNNPNKISFGIDELINNGFEQQVKREAFLYGYDPVFMLTFNVDGLIDYVLEE